SGEGALFDYIIVVRLPQLRKDVEPNPLVEYRYPPRGHEGRSSVAGGATDKFLDSITEFCFPDRANHRIPSEGEWFSFVLTSDDGARRFGYCYRSNPPSSSSSSRCPAVPACICVLSYSPCVTIFTQLIRQIHAMYDFYGDDCRKITEFLVPFGQLQLPEPGGTARVTVPSSSEQWVLTRPNGNDTPLENINFQTLLQRVSSSNLFRIFIAMLAERRMIFVSSSLSCLSECTQAAVAFLYPFHWQHVFIPVLPSSLLYFCCAPMPFVVGLLASFLPALQELSDAMEDVFIFDLDADRFLRKSDDDTRLIPPEMSSNLKTTIKSLQKKVLGIRRRNIGTAAGELPPIEKRDRLLEAFLGFFVELLSDYREYIDPAHEDGFQKALFVARSPAPVRAFIEILSGTQMFERFIAERVRRQLLMQQSLFDRRVTLYRNVAQLVSPTDTGPSRFSRFEKNLAMTQIQASKPLLVRRTPRTPPPDLRPAENRPVSREHRSETTTSVPDRYPGPVPDRIGGSLRGHAPAEKPSIADPRLYFPEAEKPRPITLFEASILVSCDTPGDPFVITPSVVSTAPFVKSHSDLPSSTSSSAAEPSARSAASALRRPHNAQLFNKQSPGRADISPAARLALISSADTSRTDRSHDPPSSPLQPSSSPLHQTPPSSPPLRPPPKGPKANGNNSSNHDNSSRPPRPLPREIPARPVNGSQPFSHSSSARPLPRFPAPSSSSSSPSLLSRDPVLTAVKPTPTANATLTVNAAPTSARASRATTPTPGELDLASLLVWLRRHGQGDLVPRVEALNPDMVLFNRLSVHSNPSQLLNYLDLPSSPKTLKLCQVLKDFFIQNGGYTDDIDFSKPSRPFSGPRAAPPGPVSSVPSRPPAQEPAPPISRPFAHRLPTPTTATQTGGTSSPRTQPKHVPVAHSPPLSASDSLVAGSPSTRHRVSTRPLPPVPKLSALPQRRLVGMNIAAFERAIGTGRSSIGIEESSTQ
ncbi:MAG: hypothetical protein Q8P67_02240, partial [archaeon]|nr:hypothetical protein [archaeon]